MPIMLIFGYPETLILIGAFAGLITHLTTASNGFFYKILEDNLLVVCVYIYICTT
jgi:hypothetical protein